MDKKISLMKKISLNEDNFWNHIPESGGVYYIKTYYNQIPIRLNRVLGTDKDGILYIGKSDNLRERLRMLWRVLNPKLNATAHPFGKKFNENKKLKNTFPLKSLYISYKISTDPKALEFDLLQKYFLKFGEVPPFNSSK